MAYLQPTGPQQHSACMYVLYDVMATKARSRDLDDALEICEGLGRHGPQHPILSRCQPSVCFAVLYFSGLGGVMFVAVSVWNPRVGVRERKQRERRRTRSRHISYLRNPGGAELWSLGKKRPCVAYRELHTATCSASHYLCPLYITVKSWVRYFCACVQVGCMYGVFERSKDQREIAPLFLCAQKSKSWCVFVLFFDVFMIFFSKKPKPTT